MADFIEQATLRVRDQSTKQINNINNAIVKLLKTAKQMNKLKISLDGVDAAQRKVDKLTKSVRAVPKSRTVTVNHKVNVTGAKAASNQLAALSRTRPVTIKVRFQQAGRMLLPPAQSQGFGRSLANSFLHTIRASNAGEVIARGFLAAIGGQIFSGVRGATAVAAQAPLNKEDALQRLRASGLPAATVAAMQDIATRMTARFPATTEAGILEAGREASGRIENPQSPEGLKQLELVMARIAENTAKLSGVLGMNAQQSADQARLIEAGISQVGATGDNERAAAISEAILQGVLASGGDLTVDDFKRLLQQAGGLRGGLGANTLLQLGLARDEQGQRGTGEARQAFEDLIRGNLNDTDAAAQERAGLRRNGRSTIAGKFQEDFLGAVETEIIPRLRKLGVNLSDPIAVQNALDTELGFSKQGGINLLKDAVVNFDNNFQEFLRARAAQLDTFTKEPTTRQRAAQVNAQFENVADAAIGPLLPVVQTGLAALTQSLSAINQGTAGVADFAKLGGGAVAAGVGAGVLALQGANTATRPLALAGISLNSSAAALTAAATALTGAAAVQAADAAVPDLPGGTPKKGLKGLLGMLLGGRATLPVAGAILTANMPGGFLGVPSGGAGNTQKFTPPVPDKQILDATKLAREAEPFIQELRGIAEQIKSARQKFGPDSQVETDLKLQAERQIESLGRTGFDTTKIDPSTLTVNTGNVTLTAPPTANPAAMPDALGGLVPGISDMTSALNSAPSELSTAFSTGSGLIDAGVQQLSATAAQIGPAMGASLLANAPQIGQAIGQAIVGIVSSATINVNAQNSPVQTAPVNTGAVGQPAG